MKQLQWLLLKKLKKDVGSNLINKKYFYLILKTLLHNKRGLQNLCILLAQVFFMNC